MLREIGIVLVTGAVLFDFTNWQKQISKVLRTKHSSQISSSALLAKVGHYFCSVTSLLIFENWLGAFMECIALICCLITLSLVIKYKPRKWRLFS
jgi:hypothetical protein